MFVPVMNSRPPSTSDLYDAYADRCQSCSTQFRQYGGNRLFSGRIRTVQCRDDNVLVRRVLESPSRGEVLVVDGGGSVESALMGDVIAELGRKNGWAGVIIFGAVRDVGALAAMEFGVKATGSNPRKSGKTGTGRVDVEVAIGGASFAPGHWVYSDDDGILVAPNDLARG
jgi:regulator of ribonuclease activity A